jgi:hypothetical protein
MTFLLVLGHGQDILEHGHPKLTLHRPSGRIVVTMEDEMRPSMASLNEIIEAVIVLALAGFVSL